MRLDCSDKTVNNAIRQEYANRQRPVSIHGRQLSWPFLDAILLIVPLPRVATGNAGTNTAPDR